jgi:hypothetical protein
MKMAPRFGLFLLAASEISASVSHAADLQNTPIEGRLVGLSITAGSQPSYGLVIETVNGVHLAYAKPSPKALGLDAMLAELDGAVRNHSVVRIDGCAEPSQSMSGATVSQPVIRIMRIQVEGDSWSGEYASHCF